MEDPKKLESQEELSQEIQSASVVSSAPASSIPARESGYSCLSLILGEAYSGGSWSGENVKDRIDTRSELRAPLLSQENVDELIPEVEAPRDCKALGEPEAESVALERVQNYASLPQHDGQSDDVEESEEELFGLARLRAIQPPSDYHVFTSKGSTCGPPGKSISTTPSVESQEIAMQSFEALGFESVELPETFSKESDIVSPPAPENIHPCERKVGWKSWGGIVKNYQDSTQRLRSKSFTQTQVSATDDKKSSP